MNIVGPAIVVGGGMAGLSAAYYLTKLGKVELYEKRIIGGLCANYDTIKNPFIDAYKEKFDKLSYKPCIYGEHVFHSNSQLAYSIFSELYNVETFELQTVVLDGNTVHRWPLNNSILRQLGVQEDTINNLKTKYPNGISLDILNTELEDKTVVQTIRDRFIVPYSIKQWGNNEYNKVLNDRVRLFFDDDVNTFRDKYQCIPIRMDYSKCKLLKNENLSVFNESVNLAVISDTFKDLKDQQVLVVNTSPIDEFYGLSNRLKYRTCDFVFGYDHTDNYKGMPTSINVPSLNSAYTRIHNHNGILLYEYPRDYNPDNSNDIPMYPVSKIDSCEQLLDLNVHVIETDCGLAYVDIDSVKNVIILHVGRLGTYNYMNMDQTILNSFTGVRWVMGHTLQDIEELPSLKNYLILTDMDSESACVLRDGVCLDSYGLKTYINAFVKDTDSEEKQKEQISIVENMKKFYMNYFERFSDMETPIVSKYYDIGSNISFAIDRTSLGIGVVGLPDDEVVPALEEFFKNYVEHIRRTIVYVPEQTDTSDSTIIEIPANELKLSCGIDLSKFKAFSHGALTLDKIYGKRPIMILPVGPSIIGNILTDMVSLLSEPFCTDDFISFIDRQDDHKDLVIDHHRMYIRTMFNDCFKPIVALMIDTFNDSCGTAAFKMDKEDALVIRQTSELVDLCIRILKIRNGDTDGKIDAVMKLLMDM